MSVHGAASERPVARRGVPSRAAVRAAARDFAHLAVLSCFALAEPMFDLLGKSPEFFAARGSPPIDILTFGIFLILVPPAVLVAVELLVGLVSRSARRVLHLLLLAALLALVVIQPLKKSIDASDAVLIAISAAIGLLGAAAYARFAPVRSFLSVLAPAPLVFLFIFLVISPISKVAFASEAKARTVGGVSRTPVVEVLFDELPSSTLMDARMRVDARRFPNFAALARDATWYRNAYAVYDSTERAQPAIFDGDYPSKGKLPTSADHPNSIFTLLGKTYRLNVSEEATSVCPRDLCHDERLSESYGSRMQSLFDDLGLVWLHVVAPPNMESELPSVSDTWGNFGGNSGGGSARGPGDQPNTRANLNRNRNKRFDEWVAGIRDTARPALNFKHTLLPHVPWQYLPDGKEYHRTAKEPIPVLAADFYRDPMQVDAQWQRHILQTGFADRELGKVLRRLKQQGMYDKTLIVVAADHGVAFKLGERDRRTLTRQNFGQIAPIPLFIKAPYQRRGKVDPAYVESVDILPTILHTLGINPRVHMDGKPATSPVVRRRRVLRILQRNTFKPLRFTAAQFQAARAAALDRRLRVFGTGAEGPLRLYRIGPFAAQLLGHRASEFPLATGRGPGARFVFARDYRRVDLRSPFVPTHVAGYLSGPEAGQRRDLAIAVNGRIAALTQSYHPATGSESVFGAMVPERAFRDGANDVELYSVRPSGGGFTLERLGGG